MRAKPIAVETVKVFAGGPIKRKLKRRQCKRWEYGGREIKPDIKDISFWLTNNDAATNYDRKKKKSKVSLPRKLIRSNGSEAKDKADIITFKWFIKWLFLSALPI